MEKMLTILGVDASVEAIAKASNGRVLVLLLARVLAAYEWQSDRNDGRNQRTCTRDYLTWRAAHRHGLSEVEQRAISTD